MNLQEFYEEVGGDYKTAVSRLMNEAIVTKFVIRFLSDDSFDGLKKSYETGDLKEAFRYVHTLKGVAYNISLNALGDCASALCEDLRGGEPKNADALFKKLEEQYVHTVKMIEALKANV